VIVVVWIGKKEAIVGGMEYQMPSPPVVIKGTTLVPVRFISEALGAAVAWEQATKTITIEYPK